VQRGPDAFHDPFGLAQHCIVPETQHPQAAPFQIPGPFCIVFAAFGMLAAVELDDEARLVAVDIDDIGRDRMLSAEFPAAETAIAQQQPQPRFRIGLPAAQAARKMQQLLRQFQ
jgi:hypothetical protein